MDALGERIVRERREIECLRAEAEIMEKEAKKKRMEADEMERLLEQARFQR